MVASANWIIRESHANAKSDSGAAAVQRSTIEFAGNSAFSSAQLRKIITTAVPQRLPTADELAAGIDSLCAFYYLKGYLEVRVEEPKIFGDGSSLITIDEGPLYRVGTITIAGDLKFSQRDVASQLTIKSGKPFATRSLQQSVVSLSDFYAHRGYTSVYLDPRTHIDSLQHRINVSIYVRPGIRVSP